MKKIKLFIILLLLAVVNFNATAQNSGDNDPTFNPNDVGFGSSNGANDTIYTTAIQSDGKIIECGKFTPYDGSARSCIARRHIDGSIDVTFNVGTGANNDILTTAIQSDGKIIIGGRFTSYNGIPMNRIARLHSDGSLDTTFNVGTGVNNDIYTTAIQPDGKIIIGGGFTSYNGTASNRIARLNVDGTLDTSFVVGSGASNIVRTTSIQSDGKIIIGGRFTAFNGTASNRIARINSDGTLDTSFIVGIGVNNDIYTTSIQSDGKIIIGGNFTSYNGIGRSRIARINSDGTLNTSFVVGSGANNTVTTTSIQSDGKIIIGGNFTTYYGTVRRHIARLNSDGTLDTSFIVGTGVDNNIYTTSMQSDGKIIIGGNFSSYNGAVKSCIARLNSDGVLDETFNPETGANNRVETIVIQSDGKIIIGGYFTSYNGIDRNGIARLNSDGSLDTTFTVGMGVNYYGIRTTSIQNDGKIIIGGNFISYNGTARNRIARLNIDGTLDTSFVVGSGANDIVRTTSIQSDGKIVIGGNFTSYNDIPVKGLARLHIDGTIDASFTIGIGELNDIITTTLQPDDKIIIGGLINPLNGTSIYTSARLNSDGSFDTSFFVGNQYWGTVYTTTIQPDGKIIIGGNFSSYDGFPRNDIARLNSNGRIDTSFIVGTGTNNWVETIVIQSDGKIIIGGVFTDFNGTVINNIARLNSDGSLDNSFIVGTGVSNQVIATAIQPDNKIIIGGIFTSYNGIGRNRIARLLQCTANNSTDTIVACDSITWIDGNTYTSSTTTPIFHVFNSAGCDSAITLNLTINATSSIDSIVACDSITWMDGNTYTTSTNAPTFILTNAVGCDSVITLNLTINSNSSTDIVTACDSITWIDGNTYTVSTNTPTYVLTNTAGCDSVVTLNLTINNSTFGTDVITACDSITWIDGNTYTVSTNTPTYVLTNTAGCDSVVTLNLTINNSTFGTDVITACDSITWIDGNNYTSSTNIPTFTLTNAEGCDSVVTLDLTINNSTFGTDIITACDSATWIDGNTYNASTNIPTFTLTNAAGCDSIVTLNLTISPIDISVVQNPFTIVAMESGATYQWLDCNNGNAVISGETNQTYIPASSGNYAVVVSKNGCTDTSICVNFCNIEANYLFTDNGNGNYTFTNATSGNYTQSHWAFGDGTTSTATNPNHTFSANGTYVVVLTVNDSTNGSCTDYYLDTIVVTGVVAPLQCAAGFVMYPDTTINNVMVVNSSTGTNLTYLWDFGDGNTSTLQYPTHTYATTGNYYLCLTVDDGAGCVDMYCDSIGENGVVFNKQTGFTINVIASPLVTQVSEQEILTSSMAIYPNPTGSVLNVVFKQNELYQLQITAIDGKIIEAKTINGNTTVDVSKYSSGMYFISATNKEGKVYQSKFVKE